jgi:hypothetical protein
MGTIRNLGLAFLIALAAGVLFFFTCTLLGLGEKIAQGAAVIPFTALSKIYDEVDKIYAKATTSLSAIYNIDALSNFGIKWYALLVYAILIQIGTVNLAFFSGGVVYGALVKAGVIIESKDFPPLLVIGLFSLPVIFIVLFLNGRWIGGRSSGVITHAPFRPEVQAATV